MTIGGTSIPDTELRLLQAIRLKGRLAPESAPTFAGATSALMLTRLASEELINVGAVGARLTPAGRERLAELLAAERSRVNHDKLAALYKQFEPPNLTLKEIVSTWQMRPDGSPNDHTEPDYDTAVILRLGAAANAAAPLVARIAAVVPRLDTYPTRLQTAVDRLAAGEPKYVTNPMVDSYHQVWFELHEELLGLLDLNREDEAKVGRA